MKGDYNLSSNFEFKAALCEAERELKKFNILHRAKFSKLAEKENIFPGQLPILVFISQNNGCTQKNIADVLNFRAASITDSLKRMEKAGLIIRKQDNKDLRVIRVFITESGIKHMQIGIKISYRMEECYFKGFSEEEKAMCLAFVKRMCRNLEQNEGGAEC